MNYEEVVEECVTNGARDGMHAHRISRVFIIVHHCIGCVKTKCQKPLAGQRLAESVHIVRDYKITIINGFLPFGPFSLGACLYLRASNVLCFIFVERPSEFCHRHFHIDRRAHLEPMRSSQLISFLPVFLCRRFFIFSFYFSHFSLTWPWHNRKAVKTLGALLPIGSSTHISGMAQSKRESEILHQSRRLPMNKNAQQRSSTQLRIHRTEYNRRNLKGKDKRKH